MSHPALWRQFSHLALALCCLLMAVGLCGQADGQVPVDPRLLDTLSLPQQTAAMQFSLDGKRLAVATAGREILLWDVAEEGIRPRQRLLWKEAPDELVGIAFSPDGELLAAADRQRVSVWNVTNGRLVNSSQLTTASSQITRVGFSADAVVVVASDGTISQLDAQSLEPLTGRSAYIPEVRAISIDGRFCARTSDGLRLSVWDLDEHQLLPLNMPTCRDDLFAIAPDGGTVALAGVGWDGRRRDRGPELDADAANDQPEKGPWDTIDGGVWAFDTRDGNKVVVRNADGRRVQSVRYSPDGACLGIAYRNFVDLRYTAESKTEFPIRLSLFRESPPEGEPVTDNDFALAPGWPPRVAWQRSDRQVELWIWSERLDEEGVREFAMRDFAPGMANPDNAPEAFFEYTVFYATNRRPRPPHRPPWFDALLDFVQAEVGLLLAVVSGVVLLFTIFAFALFRSLTWGRTLGLVFLVGFVYGGCATVHTVLALRLDPTKPHEYYGNQRGELSYGSVQVTIPNDHEYGELEGPIWFLSRDPAEHIVLQQVDAAEGRLFLERLAQETRRGEGQAGHDAFVFIHGFNVSFEDAARRTAQMAYDLKFEGVPIFFSWPSRGSALGYVQDANNSDLAGVQLRRFLLDIEKYSGANHIHLIAHSMGTRVLSNALRDLGIERLDRSRFREIILAAPDIDAQYFRYGIAPAIVPGDPAASSRRVTVYASSSDKALILSKRVNGFPRAGDAANLVVYPGVDTIDVSDLGDQRDATGHSYYGGLPDLFELLNSGKPPTKRKSLTLQTDRELPYWKHLRTD